MTLQYQPRKRRFFAGFLGVLVLLTCLRVWTAPADLVPLARAQIPDSGAQRQMLVEETRKTNRLLTEIKQLLESHTFNVRVRGADNQADEPAPAGGTKRSKP
jgi:hypothetical protein